MRRSSNLPRISYISAAEVIRKLNVVLSTISLILLASAAYFFISEINTDREAYFVTSDGDFKKIEYSEEMKAKIKKRWYEQQ